MAKSKKPAQEEFELEGVSSVDTEPTLDVSAELSGSPQEGREEEPEGLEEGLAEALVELGWAESLDHARARVAYITPRKRAILVEHLERTRKPPE